MPNRYPGAEEQTEQGDLHLLGHTSCLHPPAFHRPLLSPRFRVTARSPTRRPSLQDHSLQTIPTLQLLILSIILNFFRTFTLVLINILLKKPSSLPLVFVLIIRSNSWTNLLLLLLSNLYILFPLNL